MCKVSCIVPVYNVEKYLEKCLDSLVNQTMQDIEILVINDGSTDSSQDIIDKYINKFPQKLKCITKENGGQGSARNLGLDIAKGEYISFVDSDDWIKNDCFEKMYSVAKQNDSDIVICNMVDNFENGDIVVYDCIHYENPALKTMSACNKIFKRDLIADNRFPEKIWYEDFAFTTPLILKAKTITPTEGDFYQCHVRNVSTMNNHNSVKNLDIITAYEEVITRTKNDRTYESNKQLLEYILLEHIVVTTINRVAKQKNKDKTNVIKQLTSYGKQNISKNIKDNKYFKVKDRNFKLIYFLNINGLYKISKILLTISNKIKS